MAFPASTPARSSIGERGAIATSLWKIPHRWLTQASQKAINYLTQRDEPRITHRIHADGTATWRIYDPYSSQSAVCYSTAEVRVWLENRYSSRFR